MFFKDEYAFLSNMYESPVEYYGYTFKCAESAYQACKCPERVKEFVPLDGYAAKKLGKTVQLRDNWDTLKNKYMKAIVEAKFKQNLFLALRLQKLEGEIVEHNTWGDKYWGVCNGEGENHLGKILMDLRDYYNPFYCMVIGSREFNDYELIADKLDHLLQNKKYIVIVSGEARGVDSCAKRYAQERENCRYKGFPAEWDKYGRRAGYIRNAEMHEYICSSGKERGVIAFWDGASPGTKQSFELAIKYKNPIKIFNYKTGQYVLNPCEEKENC